MDAISSRNRQPCHNKAMRPSAQTFSGRAGQKRARQIARLQSAAKRTAARVPAGAGARRQPTYFRNATVVLCPPKPSELLMATFTSALRAVFGTQSRSHSGSGLE